MLRVREVIRITQRRGGRVQGEKNIHYYMFFFCFFLKKDAFAEGCTILMQHQNLYYANVQGLSARGQDETKTVWNYLVLRW